MSKHRHRPSAGTSLAIVAIVLSCAGSATAASVITGKQIKNSSISSSDIKNRSLLAKDFKSGQLKRGRTGATGPAGATGPQGARGTAGTAGSARAYGTVLPDGSLVRSKGATVRKDESSGDGRYCITAPGVSPETTQPVLTVNANQSSTYYGDPNGLPAAGNTIAQTFAEVRVGGGICAAGEFEILTGVQNYSTTDGSLSGQGSSDESFTFLIP